MAQKDNKDLLELFNFRQKLSSKFGKEYREDCAKWVKDYEIETLHENKIKDLDNIMQIPYIFSSVESNLPSIFETMPSVIMSQRGKEDREFTEFADKIWDYLVAKLALEEKVEEGGHNFLITGIGAFKWGWNLETATEEQVQEVPLMNESGEPVVGEDGQPVTQQIINKVEIPIVDLPFVEVYNYKRLHFAPESVFVIDDEENKIPFVVCQHVMTPDQVKEKYGKKPSKGAIEKLDLKDIDTKLAEDVETDKSNVIESDMERCVVYEYYGTLPKSVAGDPDWKSNKVYYAVFTSKDMLKAPVAMNKKPILLVGNYGHSAKFFRWGEPKVLRELEQDVSLGRSRMMDIRDKWGLKIWIPQGLEVDERALKRSGDFTILRGIGQTPPQYIAPPSPPESIMVGIDQSRSDLQMASAQLDLSRGSTESVVDTATGQKIFAAATDKRNGRKRKKMGNLIKALAKNLLILCAENWDVEMFAKIADMPSEEIEEKGFLDKMRDLGNEFDVEIEVESITSNKETMSAQAIALYKETKDDPMVNREEILKEALKIGFNKKDFERFLSGYVGPEDIIQVLQFMVENQLIAPEMAEQLVLSAKPLFQEQPQPGGKEGRPAVADPTQIVEDSMEGSDSTQITAQNDAAYKQRGVAKGPQGV